MAIALSDAYYPGRSVRFDGSPAATGTTSADLFLTITATGSTADLGPVENWPTDEDWVAGVAPLAVRVGVRFAGGGLATQSYVFAVTRGMTGLLDQGPVTRRWERSEPVPERSSPDR